MAGLAAAQMSDGSEFHAAGPHARRRILQTNQLNTEKTVGSHNKTSAAPWWSSGLTRPMICEAVVWQDPWYVNQNYEVVPTDLVHSADDNSSYLADRHGHKSILETTEWITEDDCSNCKKTV